MERIDIINGIRREAMTDADSSFPIEIFPQRVQSIILAWRKVENYVIDFAAAAMLSAASAAIGNSFRIHIRGLWTSNPALYIVMFGKPGLGKTPPIEAAYRPIRKIDEERLLRYIDQKKLYDAADKDGKASLAKPSLVQTVVSDFTVEALMHAHFHNPDGVAAVCDEIIGLINSADRYSKSNITETLLTAFSGSPLNVIRRSSDTPLFVKEPCVNIIGTTQTALLGQISDKWMNNGFLDRVIFVHPKQASIPLWEDEDESMLRLAAKAHGDWASLISRICELKKDKPQAALSFTPEARARFFRWQNSIISSVNALPEEALAETREMKRCHIAAKIALILQIMRHACGEAGKDAVDLQSVESAIMANEHFEESYETFKRAIGMQSAGCAKKSQFIALCQGEFTAADAQNVGKRLSINERTVKRWLKDLSEKGEFERLAHGIYRRK